MHATTCHHQTCCSGSPALDFTCCAVLPSHTAFPPTQHNLTTHASNPTNPCAHEACVRRSHMHIAHIYLQLCAGAQSWAVCTHLKRIAGLSPSLTHTHSHSHSCSHIQTHTHAGRGGAGACACAHMHTCTHTHAHTLMHTRTHAHTHILHTQPLTYVGAHMRTLTHTRTHTTTHTHTHTHNHTHTHTRPHLQGLHAPSHTDTPHGGR